MKLTLNKSTLIAILFIFFFSASSAQQSFNTIFPFQEDTYLYSPLGQYSFWFQTNPGTIITDSCYIRIDYINSAMIIPEMSFMTLLINDKPISSINIASPGSDSSAWIIAIPASMISPGFNNVSLSTIQRTSTDPCLDLYNKSNWVCIKASSYFTASFDNDTTQYISNFPYPFLNLLDHSSTICNVILPDQPAQEDYEAFYSLAKFLGNLKTGNGIKFDLSKTDSLKNTIYIGTTENFGDIFNTGLPEATGIIKIVSDINKTSLYVSGSDHEGIKKSLSALMSEQLRSRMDTNEIVVTNYYPPKPIFTSRNIKLTELGIKDLKIKGIFDQSEFINLRRPVNLMIGADSYLRLNFKHSANLNPNQSIITALVNGKPSASVRLDQSNTDGGFFDIKIPMDQLDRNEWMIELASYQDIGNIGQVDCSHLYNESVWTYIDAENSEFIISEGNNKACPDLKSFPYTMISGTVDSAVTLICLPKDADRSLLELSGSIASKIGKSSGLNSITKVAFGNPSEEILKSAGSIIMIGYANDPEMWNGIKDSLYIKPEGSFFNVSNTIEVLNNDFDNSNILQTISSPWGNGVLYAVMISEPSSISSLIENLTEEDTYSKINGQVTLLKNNGEIVPIRSEYVFLPIVEYESFLSQIPSLYWYLLGAILVLSVIFISMRLFRKKA